MSQNLEPGAKVMVDLEDGSLYEGIVVKVTPLHLEMHQIRDVHNESLYSRTLTFYHEEILRVYQTTSNRTKEIESTNPDESTASSSSSEPGEPNTSTVIKMDKAELKRLREMYSNFIFIDSEIDGKYREAIQVLANCESVGVVGLASPLHRDTGLDLLVLTNFEAAYIFDLFILNRLNALKEIFEADYIAKVVYNGAPLYDCLYNYYHCKMNNIFDIQVSETILGKKKHGENYTGLKDIGESLHYHFNLPLALLAAATEEIDDKVWGVRSLSLSSKMKAAQLGTFLLTLRDHLMREILEEHTTAVARKYKDYQNLNGLSLVKLSLNGK